MVATGSSRTLSRSGSSAFLLESPWRCSISILHPCKLAIQPASVSVYTYTCVYTHKYDRSRSTSRFLTEDSSRTIDRPANAECSTEAYIPWEETRVQGADGRLSWVSLHRQSNVRMSSIFTSAKILRGTLTKTSAYCRPASVPSDTAM